MFYWYSRKQSKGFLIIMRCRDVYKYDIRDKQLMKMEYHLRKDYRDYRIPTFIFDFDAKNNRLYVLCLRQFAVLNLETNEWDLYQRHDPNPYQEDLDYYECTSKMIRLDDQPATITNKADTNDDINNVLLHKSFHFKVGGNYSSGIYNYHKHTKMKKCSNIYQKIDDIELVQSKVKLFYHEEINRLYRVCFGKGNQLRITYFQRCDSIEKPWDVEPREVPSHFSLNFDEESIAVVFIKPRLLVVISRKKVSRTYYGGQTVYCVDIVTGKSIEAGVLNGYWHEEYECAYDEEYKIIYLFSIGFNDQRMIALDDMIPLRLWKNQIIDGYAQQMQDLIYQNLTRDIRKLIGKFYLF